MLPPPCFLRHGLHRGTARLGQWRVLMQRPDYVTAEVGAASRCARSWAAGLLAAAV